MEHKCLIVLYAEGVCVAKIVNKEAMEYINSVGPTIAQGKINETIPENVIYGYEHEYTDGKENITISPIQCADERANSIIGISFNTQREAMAYGRSNGIVFDSCYRGVLI